MDPIWLLIIGVAVVLGGILWLRLHAVLALLLGGLIVGSLTPAEALRRHGEGKGMAVEEARSFAERSVGERLARGFGETCGAVGLLVAMAAIVGKCLLDSGAADRLVRSALGIFGVSRAPVALLGSGFLLGIPVFFDTVFFLMVPLAKSLRLRTGRHYLLYVLSIIAGASMAHSLVPPTPGPLFVAAELGVEVGHMMLGGVVVGGVACFCGYLYARWADLKWEIPLRDSAEAPLARMRAVAERDESELPGVIGSMMPIVLPIVLIAGTSLLKVYLDREGVDPEWGPAVMRVMGFVGHPVIALGISAALGLTLLVRRPQGGDVGEAVQGALTGAGLIILITGAGGAFGAILQQTGIGPRIQELAAGYRMGVLPLAFVVTALVRGAQGSATVAMITAVGVLAGFGDVDELGFHPVYLALAIGCGSKPFPWMNDSGFWVIGKMSGLTVGETLRTFSVMLTVMGFAGLALVMLLAWVFPFA